MVWFQCEHCGENLKKPKLPIHFNRCPAYKLSCIDCGVVFNQQSVQAHSSCISEAEKYGPKGLNKGITGPASKARYGKVQKGSDVDFSRGLSTSPPWSCSLCNVKATSQETLELHGQGKKHQGRAKAAACKEKGGKQGGGNTGVFADSEIGGSKDDVKEVETRDATSTGVFDSTSQPAEKKRKNERVGGEGGDPTTTPRGSLEKKLKRGTSTLLGTPSTQQEDERLTESGKDRLDKKRKLVEEHLETVVKENVQLAGKKGRKKGKVAPGELNCHDNGYAGTAKVSGITTIVGKDDIGEQVKKGSQKDILCSPVGDGCLSDIKGQTSGFVVSGLPTALGSRGVSGKSITVKKKKKSEGVHEVHVSKGSAIPAKDDVCGVSKKEKKKYDLKEAAVYEISFREWLGEDDGTQGGTPTHPPLDRNRGKENLEQLEGVEMTPQSGNLRMGSSLEGITRVVKWKKIIREVLCKSLNGKLKRKDLKRSVLPLAQKAIDSAAVSVDRKALKAELMRQVTTSSKFVVDGKHVMLAPKVAIRPKSSLL